MKILFIIDSLRSGGKERRLVSLIEGLVKLDTIEIELIILSKKIHYRSILDSNIKIHNLKRDIRKDIMIISKFNKILNSFKPDIVHGWDNIAAIHFAPVCNIKRIPFINSMITAAPNIHKLSKRYFTYAISYPFSDVILSNSQAGLDNLFVSMKKQKVIYNGFNFERIEKLVDKEAVYKEFKIDGKNLIIGMVASFNNNKDYETFVKAGEQLLEKTKNITFVAVGDGPNMLTIKNTINKENLDYFRFLGKKSDVESIVNVFDIGVLSTYSEGISNAIMEYMAFAKPVIATDGGGTKELVVDNETGFLIDQKNADQLADKIDYLINNPDKAEQMGKKGRKRIKEFFSIERMVNETYQLYLKNIITEKRSMNKSKTILI